MPRYHAFGRSLVSEFALPELAGTVGVEFSDDSGSLGVGYGAVACEMPTPDQFRHVRFESDAAYFAWNGIGRFRAERGAITVDPLPDVDEGVTGLVVLGMAMAAALHFDGELVLHGSAVAVGSEPAMLFLGDNGAGKSTLAAAFLAAGHALLTDDVIAVGTCPGAIPSVRPAFPSMKLSREALEAFAALPGETLPPVPANAAKLRLRLRAFDHRARPVGHICLLERGEDFAIEPLGARDGLAGLLRYGYLLKFGREAACGPHAARVFAQSAALADAVSISRLTVPARLEALPGAVHHIIDSIVS